MKARLLKWIWMLKRLIFWEFARGSWQYDIVVGLILAFIFLTPHDWFGDQPRIPKASNIAMISSENGASAFFIEAGLVSGIPDGQRIAKLNQLLQIRTGNKHLSVTRVEPARDSEGQLLGYMAFARH
ncbi:MAG TPA: hypothetical protein VHW24_17400 [Bryobacteraceae bacterium]|jgi:hypothetical protein|nr:hypothetical protein [Bryobacteraceae bacterium]